MNHYKKVIVKGSIKCKRELLFEGEPIEKVVNRLLTTGEQPEVTDTMIYTERKEGVIPDIDIRTDRFDIAQKAMGNVAKSYIAKREFHLKEKEKNNNNESA